MRVELHLERGRPTENRLVVDGLDITRHVVARSIRLDITDGSSPALLTFTLMPKELELTGDLEVVVRRGTCGHEQDGNRCVLPTDHRLPHSDGNAYYWSK